jgi:hypothetical protein
MPAKQTTKKVKTPVIIEDPVEVSDDEHEASEQEVSEQEEHEDTKEEETTFESINLKFVGKHKKSINDHIETFAGQYLALIRPTNDKTVSIDAQAKDQIMYILCKLLGVVSKMDGEVPAEPNDIPMWIKKTLNITGSDYKIYTFLTGATECIKYNSMGSKVEEEILSIISKYVDDEDLMQHTVELFLLFIKRFSYALANLNWELTKKTNTKLVNGLLRNMNNNNTNPAIFKEIYEFATYCQLQTSKK